MKHTRSLITVFGSIALLTSTTLLHAAENPALDITDEDRLKHETTGVFGGAVIGGLLGGPAGAIAAAALGGWVSDLTLAKKENGQLSEALTQQQQHLIALQAEYRALEARYQVASRESQAAKVRNASFTPQARSATESNSLAECCNDSELVLHFKTNSVDIEPLYLEKLTDFVALANAVPKAVVAITGHADRRGKSANNLALSQKRVQTVEEKLQALGLRNKSLQTSAFGESKPVSRVDSFEDNFFDRRVVLRIMSADQGLLTRTND